ncbi:MAG TPA: hypothetical protein VEL07_15040 [Planctomycetota bacterium]|nr:hypothetical protein [Planctomycetota bacterium]
MARSRAHRFVRALAMIAAAAPGAVAQVAGAPAAPRPGPLPGAWLGWQNDALGGEIGENPDDFRTTALGIGARHGRWLAVVDHSILTRRHDPLPGRSDELTATLSWLALDGGVERADDRPWLGVGCGVRVADDLGGESTQNGWHRTGGIAEVELPYEDGSVEPVATVGGDWMVLRPISLPDALRSFEGDFGFDIAGQALASASGERQADLGLRLVAMGIDGAAWFGARVYWHNERGQSISAVHTAGHENGTWLQWGLAAGGWFVEAEYHIDSEAGNGRVGWLWKRRAGRQVREGASEIEGALSVFAGGSVGAQLRWRPRWLDRVARGHAQVLVDYRFGRVPGIDWEDATLVYAQPLVGVEGALFAPAPRTGFFWTPFAHLAVGVREERVWEIGDDPRFLAARERAGVTLGGAGVRVNWSDLPGGDRTASYGLCLVYEAWLPWESATLEREADREEYLGFGHGWGARLFTTIAW